MTAVTTMTKKGQVTVPLFIRQKFGLEPSQRILFTVEADRVFLKPAISFLDLGGAFRSKKPFNLKAMRKASKDYVTRRYLKNH